jgi:hypothetical protein
MLVKLVPCEKYVTEIADFKGMRLHYVIQDMQDTKQAISKKLSVFKNKKEITVNM